MAFGHGSSRVPNGFMGGETDQWTPYLFKDHTQITPWVGHPGYNLTTDMADEAVKYLHSMNAVAPDKPFFLYYVPGHAFAASAYKGVG